VRVLVTGSRGFAGGHLVPRLAARGWRTLATDREELDVADPGAVARMVAAERPDAIVHLAALSSVGAAAGDPRLAYRVNFAGARNLLAAASQHAPRARVLLVGSGEVYGPLPPGAPPWDERAPLRPASVYGWTKAAADLLGGAFAARGLDVVRVRAFNHSGPGQSDAFVLASFARQLAEIEKGEQEPVVRAGNLESIRDFMDVADTADAYVALLDPGVAAGAYNAASGVGLRIGALLERLMEIMGVRARIAVEPSRLRPADCSVGDAARLARATGWAPRVPVERMLARLADDWRTRVSAR
jgi:GDP-4-dehydro-6-deoxy-D-mannose reductase